MLLKLLTLCVVLVKANAQFESLILSPCPEILQFGIKNEDNQTKTIGFISLKVKRIDSIYSNITAIFRSKKNYEGVSTYD